MTTSRRVFLKAAAVAPLVLPSSVWSATTQPNDRIRMGFIGMGRQGRGVLLTPFLYRAQIVAVSDVDTNRREDARQRVDEFYTNNPQHGKPGCTAYNNYEDMLARDDIDAVCIATVDHWHAIQTLDALRAGKDVYCEKPLTHSISEAVEVMKAVDRYGRVLQTGSQQRSSREFRVACELARNGAIGKIERFECSFGPPGRPCDLPEEEMEPGLDWNLWIGPAQMRPYNTELSPRGVHNNYPEWRRYKEFGGGRVTDWGAHHLDIAQWAMGTDDSGPVEILPPDDQNAQHGAKLIYADGIEVLHRPGNGVVIYGQEGHIEVNRGQFSFSRGGETIARFMQREDGGTLRHALDKAERDYLQDPEVRLYRASDGHLSDFVDSVMSRKKPITHEIIGARTAICCHLMNLAYYHRQPIKWDPARCEFADGTGNPEWYHSHRRNYKA